MYYLYTLKARIGINKFTDEATAMHKNKLKMYFEFFLQI